MKEKRGVLFGGLAILLMVVSGTIWAEGIYVAQVAHGSDNGTSSADAHSILWFNTAVNWGTETGKIGPGDTVHLCGTFSTAGLILGNGMSGNPITVLFEPNAKMTAPIWSSGAIQANSRSWIIIDGGTNGLIECTDNGTALGHQADACGVAAEGVSHFTVQNLTIDNLYARTPMSADGNRFGVGVNLSGSDIIVQHCQVKEGDTMIGVGWGTGTNSNVIIHGNTIGRCNHGITIGTAQTNAILNNVTISNNRIDSLDVWNGNAGLHLDGIIIFNEASDSSGELNNLQIYGNCIGPNIGNINTSSCFVICYKAEQVQGMKIYNNIFTSTPPYYWTNGFVAASGLNALIANNTMIGSGSGISTGHNARCYNNLEYLTSAGLSVGNGGTVGDHDYNVLYFPPPSSANFTMVYNTWSGRYYTMSGWQAATGWDMHSLLEKPDIDTITGMPDASDTVARGHGKNLSEYFTTDYFGNPRPAIGPWTIGAIERTTTAVRPCSGPKNDGRKDIHTVVPNLCSVHQLLAVTGNRPSEFVLYNLSGGTVNREHLGSAGIYLLRAVGAKHLQRIVAVK
jgi:hypothetical protein